MGSLSWSPRPSGPSTLLHLLPPPPSPPAFTSTSSSCLSLHILHPVHLHLVPPNTVMALLLLLSTLAATSAIDTGRSVVSYLGDTFLLPDGCPVEDPMVQRFYQLCLESHQNKPLCTKERLSRSQVLTIPYVTNVCSAICHGMDESNTATCPHRARNILPFHSINRGTPLLQPSRPDTTFQFGQVIDRTFG